MEILYYLASACLVLFMVLATYDGFYLHIFKYSLFDRKESLFEHKTHTIRAVLFPAIVGLLFINEANFVLFLFGIVLVAVDLIVLAIDAYSEKESRSFMGGLPKWEYIIHLFANAFHFAAIILIFAIKFDSAGSSLIFVETVAASRAQELFQFISVNVMPGAMVLAMLHFILMHRRPQTLWNNYRTRISCC